MPKISKAAKDFNVSISTVIDFLQKKGITVEEGNPNARIDDNAYEILAKEYSPDRDIKSKSEKLSTGRQTKKPAAPEPAPEPREIKLTTAASGPKVIGHVDLSAP